MSQLAAPAAALLPADGIAVLSVAAGSGLPRALGALVGRERVFAHGLWDPALAGTDAVHLTLGARDEDLPDRGAAPWPSAARTVLRRRRRIDTLYGEREVGLILLSEAAVAAAVLDGAREVLRRDAPAVILTRSCGTQAVRAGLAALLPGHGTTGLADGATAYAPPGREMTAEPMPPTDEALSVTFDKELPGAGLHPPERDAPHGGRWTGAGATTWFLMPRPGAGSWRLRLDVGDWGAIAAGFPVQVDGTVHSPAVLGGMSALYGPMPLAEGERPLVIRPLLPPAVRDMRRGPRRIGLRLLRAHLFRAGRCAS